ncbi:flagellar hook protein FlgE [Alteribacillus persepolensis]|uniref:Flagellar hook protein FlgE n=1 Tax=Alteribacillus persepolensis TaxID=568899 RepID=A0A1G7YNF3_9BACI|nr:flagellar basal body rod protein FlgG [Alteribacillus persepolensis]SDG98073.1 flagellar hook protein FlgE [Alteribacillus persepolensis]
MLRSMYSGISGMKNFQQKLDVTGNNIANVNTFGFKKGRATFKDMVSQQIAGATAPTDVRGGVNPRQIGLGTQLGTIDTIHTQGSLQNTNRELDLGISGDGFFQVADEDDQTFYTRAGNFYLDEEGNIVNGDGFYLVGEDGDVPLSIPIEAESFSIGENGQISYIEDGDLEEGSQIALAQFDNPEGLEKAGDNLYQASANSGEPAEELPGEGGAGILVPGTLEMSNVDLSEEFTEMIVAQRGFQANTRGITTADEVLQELMNLKR